MAGRAGADGQAVLRSVDEELDLKVVCAKRDVAHAEAIVDSSGSGENQERGASLSESAVGVLHVRGSFVSTRYLQGGRMVFRPEGRWVDLAAKVAEGMDVHDIASGAVIRDANELAGGDDYFCTEDRVKLLPGGGIVLRDGNGVL